MEEKATRKELRRAERQRRKSLRRPSILREQFWNLPNILTLGRIAVIPLFMWLTYDGNPLYSLGAAILFSLAAITDVVDGYLARRWKMVTIVGKFMDPLADKLIVLAALVMMVRLGRIPAWLVILLLSREFVVTGLRTIAANEGMVISAGQEGKWKTSLQLVGIISLCIHYVHPLWMPWSTYRVDYNLVGRVLVYLSAIFSIWSAAGYFRAFLSMVARKDSGGPEGAAP